MPAHRAWTILGEKYHAIFQGLKGVRGVFKQPKCDSHRHDAVIRKSTAAFKQIEVIVFRVEELIHRPDGVACNCS